MIDQIFGQTKTKSFVTEENGAFVVVSPGFNALIITDIDITVNKGGRTKKVEFPGLDKDFDLILQIGDERNRFELADIDPSKTHTYNYKSQGMVKYWNGGRFEVLKNFPGKITLTVSYIKVKGMNYELWQRY